MLDKLLQEIKLLKEKEKLFDKVYVHLNLYLGACTKKVKEKELDILKELIWEMDDIKQKEIQNG